MRVRKMPIPTDNAPERRAFGPPTAAPAPDLRSVNVFVRRLGAERAARTLHQVGLDEPVDVAVENPVDVADLLLGAVVLHELIRMQDVAPDLAAERDLLLGAADLIEPRLLFFQLEVVEARLQHLHRRIAIPV